MEAVFLQELQTRIGMCNATSSPSGQLCLANPLPKPFGLGKAFIIALRSPYLKDNFFLHTVVTRWEMGARADAATSHVWSPAEQRWGIFRGTGFILAFPTGLPAPKPINLQGMVQSLSIFLWSWTASCWSLLAFSGKRGGLICHTELAAPHCTVQALLFLSGGCICSLTTD